MFITNTNISNNTNALQKATRLLNAILPSRIRNHFRHSAPREACRPIREIRVIRVRKKKL